MAQTKNGKHNSPSWHPQRARAVHGMEIAFQMKIKLEDKMGAASESAA